MIDSPKILIIDDIRDNIATTTALIRKNYKNSIILSAVTGDLGIELAKSTEPDVILLDILMPVKDGFTVCKEMKRIHKLKQIPIVFLTALKEQTSLKIKALNVGAEGFLTKPIDEASLIAMINAMLKIREATLMSENESERLRLLLKEGTHTLRKELEIKQIIEKELTNSNDRYHGLVDNLDSGVVIHAPDTSIISCNSRASEILGISVDQMLHKVARDPYWMFTDENDVPLRLEDYPVSKILSSLQPIKNYTIGILKKKNHPITYVEVNGFPRFNDKNELVEIVISFIDITTSKNNEKQLIFAANFDHLTKLHNRRYFERKVVELNSLNTVPVSIAVADINGLKLVNDAFGHKYGDELLILASKAILKSVDKKDLVARIGGDEFGIIMPGSTEKEAADKVKKIHENTKGIEVQSIELSIAVGYETKKVADIDLFDVSRSAEDIMYRQKLIEIPSMRSNAIETILTTLYEKDVYSEVHSRSVSNISEKLAKAHGLDDQTIKEIKTAGLLHDIGKIIIPSTIITKIGKLTDAERTIINTHSEIGFRILNSSTQLRTISKIVLNHHERWDGKGYPRQIGKEEIPIESRVIAIADAFDAMTSVRPYRDKFPIEKALKELRDNSGTQFDPVLVDTFITNLEEIIAE